VRPATTSRNDRFLPFPCDNCLPLLYGGSSITETEPNPSSRTGLTALRSRRPIFRRFSWQHTPTLKQLQQKQSREVAPRVEEYQVVSAHSPGRRDHVLSGPGWPASA
jgi:hypothetical protein